MNIVNSKQKAIEYLNEIKYFVLSNGDAPNKIVFCRDTAFSSNSLYIDGFNEKGEFVGSFRAIDEENESCDVQVDESKYTINF